MRLPGRTVSIITIAVGIALLGLIALQASLLKTAAAQKEQAFRQNVAAAMSAVVQKLEVGEAFTTAIGVFRTSDELMCDSLRCSTLIKDRRDSASCNVWVGDDLDPDFLKVQGDTLLYNIYSPRKVTIRMLSHDTTDPVTLVDSFRAAGTYRVPLPKNVNTGAFECQFDDDSTSTRVIQQSPNKTVGLKIGSARVMLVNRVIGSLTQEEAEPIENRIKPSHLDSLIGTSLAEAHIDLPYVFGVVSGKSDSLHIVNKRQYAEPLRLSEHRATLFPSDIFAPPSELLLYFPEYSSYIRQQVRPLLLLTIAFMAVIVACFAYTLRTIHRQRLFADRTVEFVNNMTHEFKTPLATVSLACDALLRPNGSGSVSDMARYSRMIKEENLRMQNQVDKILQMATLEDREYELTLTEVDAHEIIRKAVLSMTVCAEERGGHVTCELEAERHAILVDAVHFANIVHNLLENACKYSADAPSITVGSRDCSGGIRVTIRDEGVGIPERDRKMVFEKYYRVTSGDVQNVRGFGIGLSYVKLMTEAMGGTVDLQSEVGKGTTVNLIFPTLS
jgi:two-component system, OmpR family, phosphate regulon sensor histidine kinase PhoR